MKEKDYVALWRSHAKQTATVEEDEATGEINLDGFEFIGRRLPLQRWTKAGKVPQTLTAQMIRILRKEQSDVQEEELSTDALIAAQQFVVDAVCYVVKVPTLVTHTRPLKEGEVRYSEIFNDRPDLIDKIMAWIYAGCPGVPIKTKDGETDMKSVENFPDDSEGGAGSSPSNDVPLLPPDTSGGVGDRRASDSV